MVSLNKGGVDDESCSLDDNRVILSVKLGGLHGDTDDFFFEFDKSSGLSAG